MRKKLIQSLTLLLMVVGVGTFVSCNDINEDLYNEYQYETESRLEQLEQEIDKLEQEIETAQKGCDENCPHYSSEDIINIINEYIDEIKRTGKEPEGGLGSIISDLSTLQGRQDAADELLDKTIAELNALREQVANLKNCECGPVDLAELEAK
ncbi:MAG: hypothetical protein J1F27_07725, partial [Prevotellaceae bacterium]|nr:hypothetical protein [Prevotellaceae bacterium]